MGDTKKLWIPTCFAATGMIDARTAPDRWIIQWVSGRSVLLADRTSRLSATILLGETVTFDWVMNHGSFDVEIGSDGTFAAPELPPEANWFTAEYENGVSGTTLDEVVAAVITNRTDWLGEWRGEDMSVIAATRSTEPVAFQLIDRDGRLTFVERQDIDQRGGSDD